MQTKTLLALVLSGFSLVSNAAPIVKTWNNPDCVTGACDIKAVRIYIEKYQKPNLAGNQMTAEIEGSNKEVLSKYAFVQYLRGCVFSENEQGKRLYAYREFMGKDNQIFKHPTWAIDSASDTDPIYWSKSDFGWDDLRGYYVPRNAGYANKKDGNSWAGKVSNLIEAKIFASDLPSMSQLRSDGPFAWTAQNTSLEFKICLHKIEDVGATTDDPGHVAPNPITCMDWSSNYVYEKGKYKFVEQSAIHPHCLQP